MIEKVSYNIQEAVAASGISRTTLYELMGAGELNYSQVRGRRIIPRAALDELLTRTRAEA